MKHNDKKMFYFLIGCLLFSIVIIGATYAYFTANATNNSISGDTATTSFKLRVEKITDADNAFGLIPMRNDQSVNSAKQKCVDDFGSAGCQIYKITVEADSDTVMFLDGYIVTTPKDERLETRFSSVYTDDDEENFYTKYTVNDFDDRVSLNSSYNLDLGIKTGVKGERSSENINTSLNHTDDINCLFVNNEKIGGDVGRTRVFYVMMWVFDNGEAQDYLQGMQLAYNGMVVFNTAEGNEISATFD